MAPGSWRGTSKDRTQELEEATPGLGAAALAFLRPSSIFKLKACGKGCLLGIVYWYSQLHLPLREAGEGIRALIPGSRSHAENSVNEAGNEAKAHEGVAQVILRCHHGRLDPKGS